MASTGKKFRPRDEEGRMTANPNQRNLADHNDYTENYKEDEDNFDEDDYETKNEGKEDEKPPRKKSSRK